MTGGAPQTFELDKKEAQALVQNGKLWDKLVKYQKVGYLLVSYYLCQEVLKIRDVHNLLQTVLQKRILVQEFYKIMLMEFWMFV
jgi:hypothetical protein